MIKKTTILISFYSLCAVLLWLCFNPATTLGARLAGEDEVVPVTPAPRPPIRKPLPVRPSVNPPATQTPSTKTNQTPTPANQPKEINNDRNETKPDINSVTIDFEDVDIKVFIKFISELTGKNFVIDNGVRGNVTIVSPTKITLDEAYKVFESVLEVHGFATVPAGSIIKIVPASDARTKDIETRLRKEAVTRDDKIVTQLIPLR